MQFPSKGRELDDVKQALAAFKNGDADWRGGRVPLFVFKGSDTAAQLAREAFNQYFTENALGRVRAFPSVQRMEDEIIAMALDLFHAPSTACGFITTGGSESIIQAVQTCRDHARHLRCSDRHRGNLVIPYSAHPAFDKAAQLMDLSVRRIPVTGDFSADLAATNSAIDAETIMLVGSAPCFPYGVFDPIEALADIAQQRGLWLHVDACVGGYLAPFVADSGRPVPAFDLAIEGVSSLSADLHKFGYAPKPISTLFYRNPALAAHHGFNFDNWPNGRFATSTLVGTRAAGPIAGAWALFQHLGRDGYTAIADELMSGIELLQQGIGEIDDLSILGKPPLSIVAIASDNIDVFQVAEWMKPKGWVPGLLQQPKALHRMMSMLHVPSMPDYLVDLSDAVTAVQGNRTESNLNAEY
jgi:glutamate/tyrosine decarboxylase-like PLP-dependent enzyme